MFLVGVSLGTSLTDLLLDNHSKDEYEAGDLNDVLDDRNDLLNDDLIELLDNDCDDFDADEDASLERLLIVGGYEIEQGSCPYCKEDNWVDVARHPSLLMSVSLPTHCLGSGLI